MRKFAFNATIKFLICLIYRKHTVNNTYLKRTRDINLLYT